MAKKKFRFNPETLEYEQIEYTFAYKAKRVFVHMGSGIILGAFFLYVFLLVFDSPKEKQLKQQLNQMEGQYKLLERQMDDLQVVVSDLQERDDNMYRVIMQADPIPLSIRKSGSLNAKYYDDLMRMSNSQIVGTTTKKLNELTKQVYIQSKSYDELVALAKDRESLLEHIPAIQPVLNKDLTRVASGYGWRIHPIYNVRIHHNGMDFTAPTGTDVYATGLGTVQKAGWEQGFGNCIRIDHGFGYMTLYAHLHQIKVRVGQTVNRGEVIGTVGSTGRSTGPHLHYEVHFRGRPTDPRNYYFLDLSPDEYDRMIQLSNNASQVFD